MNRCLAYSSVAATVLAVSAFVACADPGGLVAGPDSYLSSIDGKPLDAEKMNRLRADQGCGLWMKDASGGVKTLAVKREQLGFKVPKASRRAGGSGDGRALRTSFKLAEMADTIHVECWVPEGLALSDLVSAFGEPDDWKAIQKKLIARKAQPATVLGAEGSREAQQLRAEFLDPRVPELKIARAAAPGGANRDIIASCSGQEAASKKGAVGRAAFSVTISCECYWLGPAYGDPPRRDWQCDYSIYQNDGSTIGPMYLTFSADAFSSWWVDENGSLKGSNPGGGDTPNTAPSVSVSGSEAFVETGEVVKFTAYSTRANLRWEWSQNLGRGVYASPVAPCVSGASCSIIATGLGGRMQAFTPGDSASSAFVAVETLVACSDAPTAARSQDTTDVGIFHANDFVNALMGMASSPHKSCAWNVRQALCAAGLSRFCNNKWGTKRTDPAFAKDWGRFLESLGWVKVYEGSQLFPAYTPHIGDIAVFIYEPSGHVTAYNGAVWVSDYVQPTVQPNQANPRSMTIYRRPGS